MVHGRLGFTLTGTEKAEVESKHRYHRRTDIGVAMMISDKLRKT